MPSLGLEELAASILSYLISRPGSVTSQYFDFPAWLGSVKCHLRVERFRISSQHPSSARHEGPPTRTARVWNLSAQATKVQFFVQTAETPHACGGPFLGTNCRFASGTAGTRPAGAGRPPDSRTIGLTDYRTNAGFVTGPAGAGMPRCRSPSTGSPRARPAHPLAARTTAAPGYI
jgi:hypothetical protein